MWLLFAIGGVTCWALVNILDSLVVRHYERHPIALMGNQSWFSLSIIGCLFLIHPPAYSSWVPALMISGLVAYVGDVLFLIALDRMDASVTNIAWILASLFLSVAGFLLFDERWNLFQFSGAMFIVVGVLYFSLNRHVSLSPRSLLLLIAMAALFTPFSIVQKAALSAGEHWYPVLLWPMLLREGFSFSVPWVVPSFRKAMRRMLAGIRLPFLLWNAVIIMAFMTGVFSLELAMQRGPLSLVSIVSNAQPFIVILLAAGIRGLFPHRAPRELLDWHSLKSKLLGFLLLFFGLAFLAIPQ
jgi:drug/metabolite transporter (DMT)-like permease